MILSDLAVTHFADRSRRLSTADALRRGDSRMMVVHTIMSERTPRENVEFLLNVGDTDALCDALYWINFAHGVDFRYWRFVPDALEDAGYVMRAFVNFGFTESRRRARFAWSAISADYRLVRHHWPLQRYMFRHVDALVEYVLKHGTLEQLDTILELKLVFDENMHSVIRSYRTLRAAESDS